ncbi:MAG: hypothetical protein AAF389_06250 [Gemmatimonadota bacterium]
MASESNWSGRTVLLMWIGFLGFAAAAARELPRYIDSLDQRIIYRNPDCMLVVADSMGALGLTVEERQDSVVSWTRACQRIRTAEMIEHSNRVTIGTGIVLFIFSVFTFAVTFAWGRERILRRMEE